MLRAPFKKWRAKVVASHVLGIPRYASRIVVFSSGLPARELEALNAGFHILDISVNGMLAPTERWWTPEEIMNTWPDHFDATPGHLPAYLMVRLARHYRAALDAREEWRDALAEVPVEVPTGSGETIVCLRWAYPDRSFKPVYGVDGLERATEYHPGAPLNLAASGFLTIGPRDL